MTNGEKHIEKLLSWYKEAVTEDGVCYLTSDDKNALAYALKCCKHYEDIKKDIDSWMLREEPSSSEIPNKSIEEKCPCYHCEYFEIKGWSHCKIHEDAYGDSRCNDYHKVNQDLTKVKQGSNRSEIPTGSDDCISRADALRVAKNEYLRGWHNALCKALREKYSIHCEEGNFSVIQEETITGLGLSMNCAAGKDVESYMSTIPRVTPIRPKGRWINHSDEGYVECPKCGSATNCDDNINDLHFCFSCGAEMKGSEDV